MRVCRGCGKAKPLDEIHFYRDNTKSGFRRQCVACVTYRNQLWRLRNVQKGRRHATNAFPKLPAPQLVAAVDARRERGAFFSSSQLHKVAMWRMGRHPSVSFDAADELLQACGLLWWDVWAPCPGDPAHFVAVAERGECPACEAFCVAERAFAPDEGAVELYG